MDMIETLVLNRSIILEPRSPYNFDALETIPSWEQKIMVGLIFDKLLSSEKILGFFKRHEGYEKLAFHYIWEDLFWRVLESSGEFWRVLESSGEFWRRKHEHRLEKEIKL